MKNSDIFSILDNPEMADALRFILEIGNLKSVIRQTYLIHQERRENTAEHSWHLIMMAIILQKHANNPVSIEKVIKLLAVHDLGEIGAGDTFHYAKNSQSDEAEKEYIQKLCSALPSDLKETVLNLWLEYEEGETSEALFARSLDRLQPFLYMLQNGGESWQRNKITYDMALKKNESIKQGSQELWNIYQALAQQANEDGLFFKNSAISAEPPCTLREVNKKEKQNA